MRKTISWLLLTVIFIVFNVGSGEIENLFYDSWLWFFQGIFLLLITLMLLVLEESVSSIEQNVFRLFGYFNILFLGYISGNYASVSSIMSDTFELYMIMWWIGAFLLALLVNYIDKFRITKSRILIISLLCLLAIEVVGVPLITIYLSYV